MFARLGSAVLVLVGLAWSMPARAQTPFFTEIFHNPPGTEGDWEWVEIYNPAAADVSLQGWKLRVRDTPAEITLGADAVVPALGYLVVAAKANLGGAVPCPVARVAWGTSLTLYNSSPAYVELRDLADVSVDKVSYLSSGFPGVEGHSLAVRDVAVGGGSTAANWVSADCIYGQGASAASLYGTPGAPNHSCAGLDGSDVGPIYQCLPAVDAGEPPDAATADDAGLPADDGGALPDDGGTLPDAGELADAGIPVAAPFFSEIYFDAPGTSDSSLEWVELYNPTAAEISLAGWAVQAQSSSSTSRYLLPAGAVLAPGAVLLVAASANLGNVASCTVAQLVYGASLTLYNSSSPRVLLLDAQSVEVDAVYYQSAGFPAPPEGHSLAVVDLASPAFNNAPQNWAVADCPYGSRAYGSPPVTYTSFGTPGLLNQSCAGLDGGPALACVTAVDGGTGVDAGPAETPKPFISEIFFDAPGTSDSGLEWLELFNPTAGSVDLSGWTIRSQSGSSQSAYVLPAGSFLAAGEYAVVAANGDLGGVAGCWVARFAYGSSLTLYNSTTAGLTLTDALGTQVDAVYYQSSGFPPSNGGHSLAVVDVHSPYLNNQPSNWAVSDCVYGSKEYGTPPVVSESFGTPGLPNTLCLGQDAGAPVNCIPVPDGGPVGTDAGRDAGSADGAQPPEPLDASVANNREPTLAVTQPTGSVQPGADGGVRVEWQAADPDGDTLAITVLRSNPDAQTSGEEVAVERLGNGSALWDTTGTPPGSYRVLVRADDGHGHVVVVAAPGTVTVPVPGAGLAQVFVDRPQGGETTSGDLTITVRTTATDGTLAVFYDKNNSGADGTPIAGGIRARPGVVDVVWKTGSVSPGKYYVYAVLQSPQGTATAYSAGAVTVQRGVAPCGCQQTREDGPVGCWVVLGGAVLALMARRRMRSLTR